MRRAKPRVPQSASIDVVGRIMHQRLLPGVAYAGDFEIALRSSSNSSPTLLMNDEIVRESHFATNTANARAAEA